MYQIDRQNKNILPINKVTFSSLQYREREDLQEWIVKNPGVFGEDLLIIQKEFDGFDSRERLDLLAIDKDGNLVVIENKLDDTGRDVVWQALKYASYCSTLRREEIIHLYQQYLDKYNLGGDAKKLLGEFFENVDLDELELNSGQSQRIIFVAAHFRKEVTSPAIWLMDYGLRIQCFKTTIYTHGETHLLTFEQIIPIKEAEDYIISMNNKKQEEIIQKTSEKKRHEVRKIFWEKLLSSVNQKTDLFSSITPNSSRHRLWAGSGISSIVYSLIATKSYVAVELYLHKKEANDNKVIFDKLLMYKDNIESEIGYQLNWDPLEGQIAKRISYSLLGVNVDNEADRDQMIDFLSLHIAKLYQVMDPYLEKIREEIRYGNITESALL